jgi:translation initiation factor IF-2
MTQRSRSGGSRSRGGATRGKSTARATGAAVKAESRQVKAESHPAVVIPKVLTVKRLAETLGVSGIEVIKHLMRNGIMANLNQSIDFDVAASVAADLGVEVAPEPVATARTEQSPVAVEEDASALEARPPVITIMGHVDHGKTKLLDAIRKTNVAETEAGSITQHIGAYQVDVGAGKITFLDTPGHEAFTAMRARGARATDIAVLVVAADDGVMPQTLEAIDHARAAGVPIVVAINKIDKPEANPDRVKQQLADQNLLIEEWGGDVVCVEVSAKRGDGLSELLDNLLVVAEVQELKANPSRPAVGVVVEASLDSTRGPVATVLVQTGTLKVGDIVLVGETWGKVKAMVDDKGKRVRKAEPSMPVEILGLNTVVQAGEPLAVVSGEKEAKAEIARRRQERETMRISRAPSLSDLYAQIQSGQIRELDIVLKTDVQGSLEPIRTSLERLGSDELKVRIVHSGTGNITENDVMLAAASRGIVIGFNNRSEPGAKILADSEGVDIRIYQVIYKLVEDVEKALAGLLEPVYEDVPEGHAEVRAVFSVRPGKIAGAYVTDGKLTRGGRARVVRGGEIIHDSTVSSLKHFKDNVREMTAGFECGVGIDGFSDFQVGDIVEAYRKEKAA